MCKNPAMTHEIAVLALDEVVVFDLGVAAQIFGAARDDEDRPLYRVRTCTPDGAPVRTSAGFRAVPDEGPEILETAGTVVVAGIHGGLALTEGRLLEPVYNLGSGDGVSVRQIMTAVAAATGIAFTPEIGPRRPGDPARIVASGERAARDLGWAMRHTLDQMVASAWLARSAH